MVSVTKSKPSAAQRRTSRIKNKALRQRIDIMRERYNAEIRAVSLEFKRKEQYVATQLYRGGALVSKKRLSSVYNAYLHRQAKKRKENNGVIAGGRNALPLLAKATADEQGWRNLSKDECEELLQELEEDNTEAKVVKLVSPLNVASHYEKEFDRISAELIGLGKRAGFHYLLMSTKKETMDVITPQIFYTPEIGDATMQLFKVTPNDLMLRTQSYITAGLAGVIRESKVKRLTALKQQIRELVLNKLHSILQSKRSVPVEKFPKRMEYANYKSNIVKAFGVRMEGWTMPGFTSDHLPNPGDLMSVGDAERLFNALNNDACKWVTMSKVEWEQVKGPKKQKKKKCHARKAKSTPFVDSDIDDDYDSPAAATEPASGTPITSSNAPSTSSNAPGTSSNAPSTSSNTPSTSSNAPSTSSNAPSPSSTINAHGFSRINAAQSSASAPSTFSLENIDPSLHNVGGTLSNGTGDVTMDSD